MRSLIAAGAATIIVASIVALRVSAQGTAAASLPADVRADIDRAVSETLAKTGAPSASIAVVRDGAIAYTHAYGSARLEPKRAATTDMRYSIGSISKQFTSTAILLLAEQGKLS